MRKRTYLTFILLGLLLTTSSILMAQTETPTPGVAEPTPTVRPVDLICDLDTLLAQQAELAAQLEAFQSDVGANAGLALDNLFKVGAAFQELALQCGYIPADAADRPVGTDVERTLTLLDEVSGDPINGQLLYNTTYSCAGCHEGENHIAPLTEGTYTRIEETRLSDPSLAGYTPEQYIVESITQPGSYLVPGHQNIMPNDFGERLTLQELADLVTYLESQDQPEASESSIIMPVHTTFEGQLTSEVPSVTHTFDGKAGTIVISTLSSGDFDSYLSLLAVDNVELTNNDDFSGTTNSRIGPILLPTDGTYTFQVDSYDRQSAGSYILELDYYEGCGIGVIGIVNSPTDPSNLRSGPGTNFDRVGNAHNGECLQVVGRSNNNVWLKIQTSSGRGGWMQAGVLELVGDNSTLPIMSS